MSAKSRRAVAACSSAASRSPLPTASARSIARSSAGVRMRPSALLHRSSSRSSVSAIVSLKTALRSSERSSAKSRVRLPPVASKRLAFRSMVISCPATSSLLRVVERLALQHLQPGEVRASVHAHGLRPPAGASSARRSPTAPGRSRRRSARPASATASSASVSTPVAWISCSASVDCRAVRKARSSSLRALRPAKNEPISEAIVAEPTCGVLRDEADRGARRRPSRRPAPAGSSP